MASSRVIRARRGHRVVGVPRPRRVAAAPVERPGRVDVAQAAGVDLVVRRLHHQHEVRGAQVGLALQQRRERALAEGSSSRPKNSSRPCTDCAARPGRRPVQAQLDHHRQRGQHVAWPRGRGPPRRRDGQGGCPAPGPCRSGRPDEEPGPVARPGVPASTQVSRRRGRRRRRPAGRRGRARRGRARPRDSEGMSISSSVLAARRSPSSASDALGTRSRPYGRVPKRQPPRGHYRCRDEVLRDRRVGQADQPAARDPALSGAGPTAPPSSSRRSTARATWSRRAHRAGVRPRRRRRGDRRAVRSAAGPARRRRAAARTARAARRPLRALAGLRRAALPARACRCTRFPRSARRSSQWETWMTQGFALFDMLTDLGHYRPEAGGYVAAPVGDGAIRHGRVVETYPDAVFCSLLGHRPSPKRTPWGLQQRIAALKLRGVIDADGGLWHRTLDELDACAAAYAAYTLANGTGSWVGDPREGVILLPVLSSRRATRSCRRPSGPRSPEQRSALDDDGRRLDTALAVTPGARPSSSAASRDISETIRKGPQARSTFAMTPSRSTRPPRPAGGCGRWSDRVPRGPFPQEPRELVGGHDPAPPSRPKLTRPARSHRRSVSMLTPSAVAAVPIGICSQATWPVCWTGRRGLPATPDHPRDHCRSPHRPRSRALDPAPSSRPDRSSRTSAPRAVASRRSWVTTITGTRARLTAARTAA